MKTLNPMQRVLTSLGHQEPDRVPFFLLLTTHGAKELGISIREYFSHAKYVVEGQLRLQARYRHDCLYGFFHAPLEVQAFGGEVVFCEEGPPNSGLAPTLKTPERAGVNRLWVSTNLDTLPFMKGRSALVLILEAMGKSPGFHFF